MKPLFRLIVAASAILFFSCNNSGTNETEKKDSSGTSATGQVKEENVTYNDGSTTLNGYVVYRDSGNQKRPAVLVVHEWWGLNDYPKSRAKQLADLGYVAMAVDMFGNGKTADNPKDAGTLAGPFYQDQNLIRTRFEAALQKLKSYPNVDTNNIAAIGYCYGGFVVLNAAKLGENLKGVVSFHGNLGGIIPDKNRLKSKILVLHGEADPIVQPAEVAMFKKQMDSVGVDYTFKSYPNAKHAFTNPRADSVEKNYHIGVGYNADADRQSWEEMKSFLSKVLSK